MASESQNQWNHPCDSFNADDMDKKAECQIEKEADKLFQEDRFSDLQISQKIGISFTATKMLRIRYERAHFAVGRK